jgi:hypothetical protein
LVNFFSRKDNGYGSDLININDLEGKTDRDLLILNLSVTNKLATNHLDRRILVLEVIASILTISIIPCVIKYLFGAI